MSAVNLESTFQNLQTEIDRIIDVKTVNDEQAIDYAKMLAHCGADYRRELFNNPNEKFKKTLKITKIQLPLALKAIKLVSISELQFHDELKRELSSISRIFLEIVLCQCIVQGRSLYKNDHEQLHITFAEMVKTLPDKEVLTGFELRCCRAALKNFASITARAKKVAEEGIPAVLGGIAQTISSARPAPPYVNPAPVLLSALSVANAIYKQKKELWYLNVFELKMLGFEVGLQTIAQYKEIKENLHEMASKNANLAFYICQLFKEIIDNPKIEADLKKELFQGEGISIVRFARVKPLTDVTNKYWKVRYLALSYLQELMNKPEYYTDESQKVIIRQLTRPFDKRILRKKAYQVSSELLQVKCDNLQQVFQEILNKSDNGFEINSEQQQRLQSAINKNKKEIKSLENKLKFRASLGEQSTETSAKLDEEVQEELEEKKSKCTKAFKIIENGNVFKTRSMLQEVIMDGERGLQKLLEKADFDENGGFNDSIFE